MKRANFTIICCQTDDKQKIMDILCDANEYQLKQGHVDDVYYRGDNRSEETATDRLVMSYINLLKANGIHSDTKPEYIDEWFFLRK